MPHDVREQKSPYKEKILKIVEDQTACRHIALVIGKSGGPRWIPASENMKEGMVITNDPSGTVFDRNNLTQLFIYLYICLIVYTISYKIKKKYILI